MDLQLAGRRCLVTGASAGIGAAIVAVLAAEGAQVAAVARRAERLEALADGIEGKGHSRPAVVAGDITSREGVAAIIKDAEVALGGPVEILVNCAGGSRPATLDSDEAFWDEAMLLNFTAGRWMSHAVLPAMRAEGWGRILNITGMMEPLSLNAALAAKGAFNLWAKGLSRDLAPEGITINTLAPGRIHSEQVDDKLWKTAAAREAFAEQHIPMKRFGDPEEMANLAAFMVSPLASYITGQLITVDGGMKRSAV
ncbi:SDR family NAD(P)-dependent oxidoreductase [Paracoccus sp. (in: a-proteobacteria)]|uniref:SDR family NAD(P)-dependent oxidoreductase n=1 Tax=Paracoccus sp. TaxID=267 RepID=UPI002AFF318B|nr:SDR family oxidoreductase [Paracoccus sp. (in: a-proteobacteria)]